MIFIELPVEFIEWMEVTELILTLLEGSNSSPW